MADIRACEQCGTMFSPRREHARFCSGRCRVAWNRVRHGDPAAPDEPVAEASALQWSVTAMSETIGGLPEVPADRPGALTLIGDTVWQLTIVDATLVRYYAEVYDRVMAEQPPAERHLLDGTMGGLRFVRNRMRSEEERAAFLGPPNRPDGPCGGSIGAWIWRSLPEPELPEMKPRARSWELTRYRAYQEFLAGQEVGATFSRAAAFLLLAAGQVPELPPVTAPAPG